MNSEVERLRTLFHEDILNVYDKNFITKKGFYLEQTNKLKCYKCEEVIQLNQPQRRHVMYLIAAHQCHQIIHSANVEIPSPYDDRNPTNWSDDLNYEEFRYATFTNWMSKQCRVNRTTLELAEAGFFFTTIPNTITCFYCRTVIFADNCDMTCANRAIKIHDTNKKCEQQKCALQARGANDLIVFFPAQPQHKKSTPQQPAEPLQEEEDWPSTCQSTPWPGEYYYMRSYRRTAEEYAKMMADRNLNWEFKIEPTI